MKKKKKIIISKSEKNRGRFKKGKIKTGGRVKGTPNKLTQSAKEAFQIAFDFLGGPDGLMKWAKKNNKNRTEFYKLYSKLIPTDITSGGDPITSVQVSIIGNKS